MLMGVFHITFVMIQAAAMDPKSGAHDSTLVVRRVDKLRAELEKLALVKKGRIHRSSLEVLVDGRGRMSSVGHMAATDLSKRSSHPLAAEGQGSSDEELDLDDIFLVGPSNLTLNYSSLLSAETIDNLELRRTHTLHRDVFTTLMEEQEKTNVTHVTKLAFSWAPGAFLCGFGSTLSGLGVVLQKYSHVLTARMDLGGDPYYLQPWWLVGFAIWLVAEAVDLLAMSVAPQVVITSMKSWTVTCTLVMAKVILGEELNCIGFQAITGLLVGTGLLASYAPMAPPPNSDDAWQPRLTSRYFMYGVLAFAGILVSSFPVLLRYFTDRRPGNSSSSLAKPWNLAPFCWAGMAALCTGVALTLCKCVAMMTIAGTPLVTVGYVPEGWSIPALVLASLIFGVLEVHSLNLSLQLGDVVLIYPIYLCLGTVARMILTGTLLEEFGSFSTWGQTAMFWCGLCLIAVSTHLLFNMKVLLSSSQDSYKSSKDFEQVAQNSRL
jgi:hypothetical protein